jgi:MinD superfamily P-loop ATPase
MPFLIVAENCTGCTACEKRCPTRAISGEPKKAFFIEPALCIDCGACGVICPDEAILDTWGNITKVLKRDERPAIERHCSEELSPNPHTCQGQNPYPAQRTNRPRNADHT